MFPYVVIRALAAAASATRSPSVAPAGSSEAESAYLKAISVDGASVQDFNTNNITITYNLARLYEDTFEFEKAIGLYQGILKEHPNYIDAYLRLGCIYRTKGHTNEASKVSLSLSLSLSLARSHYNRSSLENWTDAKTPTNSQQWFRDVTVVNKYQPDALCMLGNLHVQRSEVREPAAAPCVRLEQHV